MSVENEDTIQILDLAAEDLPDAEPQTFIERTEPGFSPSSDQHRPTDTASDGSESGRENEDRDRAAYSSELDAISADLNSLSQRLHLKPPTGQTEDEDVRASHSPQSELESDDDTHSMDESESDDDAHGMDEDLSSGLQFLESNAPGSSVFRLAEGAPEEVKEEPRSVIREILSWVIPMAAAVLVALLLKNYVIINANVPSGSMLNTIQKGDDLFGNRLAYHFTDPKRGDIIIFYYPDDPSTKYIKRIIGEPGDKVVIQNAKIYINDSSEPLEENYLPEEWVKNNDGYVFQVPEDHYLMLGDNRNDSWDSRFWQNTYVSRDAIIGKAWIIYYPFDHISLL